MFPTPAAAAAAASAAGAGPSSAAPSAAPLAPPAAAGAAGALAEIVFVKAAGARGFGKQFVKVATGTCVDVADIAVRIVSDFPAWCVGAEDIALFLVPAELEQAVQRDPERREAEVLVDANLCLATAALAEAGICNRSCLLARLPDPPAAAPGEYARAACSRFRARRARCRRGSRDAREIPQGSLRGRSPFPSLLPFILPIADGGRYGGSGGGGTNAAADGSGRGGGGDNGVDGGGSVSSLVAALRAAHLTLAPAVPAEKMDLSAASGSVLRWALSVKSIESQTMFLSCQEMPFRAFDWVRGKVRLSELAASAGSTAQGRTVPGLAHHFGTQLPASLRRRGELVKAESATLHFSAKDSSRHLVLKGHTDAAFIRHGAASLDPSRVLGQSALLVVWKTPAAFADNAVGLEAQVVLQLLAFAACFRRPVPIVATDCATGMRVWSLDGRVLTEYVGPGGAQLTLAGGFSVVCALLPSALDGVDAYMAQQLRAPLEDDAEGDDGDDDASGGGGSGFRGGCEGDGGGFDYVGGRAEESQLYEQVEAEEVKNRLRALLRCTRGFEYLASGVE